MKRCPFEIKSRKVSKYGIRIFFRHLSCNGQAEIFISDKDELTSRLEVACSCGESANLYFGDPKFGRRLLEVLRRPALEDAFDEDTGSPLN